MVMKRGKWKLCGAQSRQGWSRHTALYRRSVVAGPTHCLPTASGGRDQSSVPSLLWWQGLIQCSASGSQPQKDPGNKVPTVEVTQRISSLEAQSCPILS